MLVQFRRWPCEVVVARYANGRIALKLESGWEPIATATVNVPEAELAPDEVIIKDYSENEGMLAALVKAGVVEPTGRMVQTGYVSCPVCKWLGPLAGEVE